VLHCDWVDCLRLTVLFVCVRQFEFLICVDNSGSMATKSTAFIESLVAPGGARKLEFCFAVSLWGRDPGKLLHDFH